MQIFTLCCALVVAAVCSGVNAFADFTGWVLVRTTLTIDQRASLEQSIPDVDFWHERWLDASQSAFLVDAFLSPEGVAVLKDLNVHYDIVDETVQETIEAERERLTRRKRLAPNQILDPAVYFQDFRELDEIYLYCDEYLMQTYRDLMTPFVLGQTVEGRTIRGYRIASEPDIQKPGIYLDAQVHAREWLATPTLLYELTQLMADFENGDPEARELLGALEVHFVPLVNHDGFLYTWTDNRLWRKNRRPNLGGTVGVDLNRNWGPNNTWCTSGSSTNPSSDTYCGTAPFSEPEIEATRAYIDGLGIFRAGIDYHTSGPLLLWPWQYSYDRIPEPDYSDFFALGQRMETAINDPFGFGYRSIQGVDLYPHAGGFIDYNYQINGMYTFTLEGRGPGFTPPPSAIIPSGIENYEALKVLMHHVIDKEREE